MANITIPATGRRLGGPLDITEFLRPFGIHYERWPLEERVPPDGSAEEILTAYAAEIERLKAAGGYLTADVISVTPETPDLETLLERVNKEHYHSEDEVRFILKGAGLFHIRPADHAVFALQLEAGDLINVPAGTRHWFHLCADRSIRAIRLFRDPAGWVAHYVADGAHGEYSPLCWGPRDMRSEAAPVMP